MKFGKELDRTVETNHPAWKKYAVDYKGLKKALKQQYIPYGGGVRDMDNRDPPTTTNSIEQYTMFWEIFERSQSGLDTFYKNKEAWAKLKHATLESDVQSLRSNKNKIDDCLRNSGCAIEDMKEHLIEFRNETELIREFLQVNQTAFSKILKKFDKRTFSRVRETKLASVMESQMYLDGAAMDCYLKKIDGLIDQLDALQHNEYMPQKAGQKRRFNERTTNTSSILEAKAREVLQCLEDESPFFSKNPTRELPTFARNEIEANDQQLLGKGHFCNVYEIKEFYFKADETNEARLEMQRLCVEDKDAKGNSRYAIKEINPFLSTASKVDGAIDLAIEAKFLSCLQHPNIVSLLATPTGSSPYFLILDRLYDSLNTMIHEEWYAKMTKLHGKFGVKNFSAKNRQARKDLWLVRLRALQNVAAGMQYLHGKNIIHRDIKPMNLGFDKNGNAKIFDFGLVKELQPRDQVGSADEFRATGRTGTRKYMAPEVVLYKPYGKPVDIYSFALTCWETMSLKMPFDGMSLSKLNGDVLEKGKRPTIPRSWPKEFSEMLTMAWATNPMDRPKVEDIYTVLSELADP